MSDKKLTGDPRVDFGWFSRRYETAERHREAQDKRDAEKGSAAKAEQVVERRTERAAKTSQEQIAILDQRLGAGQGAVRERAKLTALISK